MLREHAREVERQKYVSVYRDHPDYRMRDGRLIYAQELIDEQPFRGSYLDIGCGRGEMIDFATDCGYTVQRGVEVVPELVERDCRVQQADAWALPWVDGQFELVTLFDVMEHLLPEDCVPTLREAFRVAQKVVIITAANYTSNSLGQELHVNRLPYETWDAIIRGVFGRKNVRWLDRKHGINSESWLCQIPE